MAVDLEERVDSLETILGQFIAQTGAAMLRMERSTEKLKEEMRLFKDEMSDFKDEMRTFKDEMSVFKDEMTIFKEEMRAFKDEMKDFKNEMQEFKNEMLEFKNEMRDFKDEMLSYKEENRRENIKMNQRMGQLANKLGVVTESLVYPSIRRIIREWFDLEAETIMVGVERQLKDGSFKEFDVLAIAEEYAFWVSTKTTLRNQYVNEFVKEIPDFRKFFPEYQDKKLIGILAALVINKAQLRYAERKGFLVIGIGEEIMEVKNSKGFKPKIW